MSEEGLRADHSVRYLVSKHPETRAVTRRGQLGVVSGTGIDNILVRRLHDGDPGGHYRRALDAFPVRDVASEDLKRFFRPEGSAAEPYPGLLLYPRALTAFQEPSRRTWSRAPNWSSSGRRRTAARARPP